MSLTGAGQLVAYFSAFPIHIRPTHAKETVVKRIATTILLCLFALVRSAGAAGTPDVHRHSLTERLTRDMHDTRSRAAPKAFSDEDWRRVSAVSIAVGVESFRVSDEDIALLNEYYHLLRKRVTDDALEIKNRAKHGEPTDAEIEQWESDREKLTKLGAELAAKGEAVKRLAMLIYASVPGYSLREYSTLPENYYVFNEETGTLDYVGPVSDAALAEAFAPAIVSDSPLYFAWVEMNRDHYKRWLGKHHDLYARLSEKEPKLAAAVRGDPPVKPSTSSRATGGAVSHGSTTTASRGSGGSWGAPPARMKKNPPSAPLPRPATPIPPRTGVK
jgi:hypothetical protein